jgi:hypothetical protein
MKRKCKNGKAEARTKSEKADGSLKVSSLPSFGFFKIVFLCVLSSLCLRKRKKRQHCDLLFFV